MVKKNKVTEAKIEDLIPDELNANKGTEYGSHLIEESLRKYGAGRSILIDKKNRIIAGNKTIEHAEAIGLDNVIVVETTGNQIVAVKRTDIDLDTKEGREMAIADNSSAKANISWDAENLQKIQQEWDVKPEDWGVIVPEPEKEPEQPTTQILSTRLIVECGDATKLEALFNELQERGFACELKE